jgi:NAD(P)-dependent dehydrogenase (short-subunit alcohol dehydrogenase family)
MGELELGGKRVIVTGAAGGLGRAFAEAFAAAGASVVAADIDIAGAEETARLIAARGGRALPQAVDVTDLASAERLARVTHEGLGGADVLVNNAAVYAGLQRTSFDAISEAEWDRVMSVNVKGTWIMTRAVAPLLRACRRHAPDRVADVVGDQQRALLVDRDADRAALRLALVVEEAGQHVLRLARRLAVRTARRSPCSRRGACDSTSRAGR